MMQSCYQVDRLQRTLARSTPIHVGERITQRMSREKHFPGLREQRLQRPQSERGWLGPQSERALAKASKVAGPWKAIMKFGFYSKCNRKSFKFLNKDCQRNKANHDHSPLHLHFKVNVCQVVLRQDTDSLRKVLYLRQHSKLSGIDPRPRL